jgi:hypothetical protein
VEQTGSLSAPVLRLGLAVVLEADIQALIVNQVCAGHSELRFVNEIHTISDLATAPAPNPWLTARAAP